MQLRTHNLGQTPSRAAVWLLAMLCLWMGSGGVLHHTDDLGYAASLAQRTSIGHATPPAPPDDCAACEWTQGLQTGLAATISVPLPLNTLIADIPAFLPRLLARPSVFRSPRAPPLFLS